MAIDLIAWCKKCGAMCRGIHYDASRNVLKRRCMACGYSWSEPTLDHREKRERASLPIEERAP